ncbi:WD40 repeat domain-containing protein, partial [Micromonospora sp. NPDC049580]|uniref:WD40 repeat domain-containing protein n=1 Tax=Micromonospora sp. NPDC049580 TaxID=3154832 RepID=UPI00342CDF27
RADPAAARALAAVIARRAERNFLVAALTAYRLSVNDHLVDVHAPGFDESTVPRGIGEAFRKHFDALPPEARGVTRGLLTALAYARGDGLDDHLWLKFATALGYQLSGRDLDDLRDSPVASYLIRNVSASGIRVTRLFHQALVDELLAGRDRREDERRIIATLRRSVAGRWGTANPYAVGYAADHAAAAGELQDLLDDDEFLLHADLHRVVTAVDRSRSALGVRARLVRLTLHAQDAAPAERAAMFNLTAQIEGYTSSFARHPNLPYGAWANTNGRHEYTELSGNKTIVHQMCAVRLGDRRFLVTVGEEQEVDVWDPVSGRHERRIRVAGAERIFPIRLADRDLLAISSRCGGLRVFDAATGSLVREHRLAEPDANTCAGVAAADDLILLYLASGRGTVRLWDAHSGELRYELTYPGLGAVFEIQLMRHDAEASRFLLRGHRKNWSWAPETDSAPRALADEGQPSWPVQVRGRCLMATEAIDGAMALVDPVTREVVTALEGQGTVPRGVCFVDADECRVVAACFADGSLRLWDPYTGSLIGNEQLFDEAWRIWADHEDGRPVIISACDQEVGLWDAATLGFLGSFQGPAEEITMACPISIGSHLAVAVASNDSSVRLWRPGQDNSDWPNLLVSDSADLWVASFKDRAVIAYTDDATTGTVNLFDVSEGAPYRSLELTSDVRAACALVRDGRNVLATASPEGLVQLWDTDTGRCIASRTGGSSPRELLPVDFDGTPFVLSLGPGGVAVWNMSTMEQVAIPASAARHERSSCVVGSGWVVVTDRGTVDRIDLRTMRQRTLAEVARLTTVAEVQVSDDRLLAIAEPDHTITVRDPISGAPRWTLGPPGWSADGSHVMASTRHGLVIQSRGADETIVRVWQPTSGEVRTVAEDFWSSDVLGVARVNGDEHLAVTFDRRSIDLLDLPFGRKRRSIPVHRHIEACFDTPFGLVVRLDMGFIVLRL